MIGSTLVFETDRGRLARIDLDDLDRRNLLDLDVMNTLDFEVLVMKAGLSWAKGEPVVLDEERGVVVFGIDPAGLRYITGITGGVEAEKLQDIRKLAEFVEKHGFDDLYEIGAL